MELDQLTLEEIKKGYRFQADTRTYVCNVCARGFETGEIFAIDGRYFEASRAVELHVAADHHDYLKRLIYEDSKYNTLTDHQKELLSFMQAGLSDKEIGKKLGVSPSTVRHQRFTFREKAKQAKLYLAIYEQVMESKSADDDALLQVHQHATMVDDRYLTTEKEKQRILETAFSSLSPLKLIAFPAKEKKKIVVLGIIAEQFERGKTYTEPEINQELKSVFEDHAVLRRYLVDYGFMDRTPDGKEYWLK